LESGSSSDVMDEKREESQDKDVLTGSIPASGGVRGEEIDRAQPSPYIN